MKAIENYSHNLADDFERLAQMEEAGDSTTPLQTKIALLEKRTFEAREEAQSQKSLIEKLAAKVVLMEQNTEQQLDAQQITMDYLLASVEDLTR